jgi:hypothetical protein
MGRTARLRAEIVQYLLVKGPANTSEILDHLNSRFRWGATMNQIGNVLARDSRITKSGFQEGVGFGGLRQRVCVWSIIAN